MTEPPAIWPTYDRPPSVVFIDVDGTLLAETTSFLLARLLRQRGMIDQGFLLRAAFHGLQHRFGRLDYGRLLNFGLQSIRHIPMVDLERASYENFARHVKPRLYQGVVEHFEAVRRAGSPLVLVSSSPSMVISPLAIYLGCSDMLTTPVRVERGLIEGIGEGPPCYGEGKLQRATRWAEERSISLDEAAAYADNWSDRALLQRVGRAVVVHPGRRLRRLAADRGWFVARPKRPVRPGAPPAEND
jgi:HAD superfamily hydrolase (TIGR01490 family)